MSPTPGAKGTESQVALTGWFEAVAAAPTPSQALAAWVGFKLPAGGKKLLPQHPLPSGDQAGLTPAEEVQLGQACPFPTAPE